MSNKNTKLLDIKVSHLEMKMNYLCKKTKIMEEKEPYEIFRDRVLKERRQGETIAQVAKRLLKEDQAKRIIESQLEKYKKK